MHPQTAAVARPLRLALASLSLSMLLAALGTSIANVGLPTLTEAFGATFSQVQWVVIAYLIAVTSVIAAVGRLGDRIGRRRLLVAGIGIFTLASFLCGVAPTLALLVAARALQGLGAAIMMALAMALVGDTVPSNRTGSVMGLLGTMTACGMALGPATGGMLIAGFGWRALFLVNVPLGLLTLVLALRCLPADAATGARQAPVPWHTLPTPGNLAMSALVSAVMMATLVVGPFYLARALDLQPAQVGLAMAAGPLVAAVSGVPAGRLVDRFGAGGIGSAGLAAMVAGCVLLALVPLRFGVPAYLVPLAVLTAGYALFQAANNTAVMGSCQPAQRGMVSGLLNLSRNLGFIFGAWAMGALFAFGAGTADIMAAQPTLVAAGMHLTFGAAALLVVAALLISARLLSRR